MASLLSLVLVGCGGHASDLLSVIEARNNTSPRYSVVGYLDDDLAADDTRVRRRGVYRVGSIDDIVNRDDFYALGIGYPKPRSNAAARPQQHALPAEPIVHPAADLSTGVTLSPGVAIFGGSHVGPLARVAEGAMIGRGAIIGHDTIIAEYVSVMPGAVVSGDCYIGPGALIGSNATVLEGLKVGAWSTVGAGAVLTRDLAPGCTAVGVPARVAHRP